MITLGVLKLVQFGVAFNEKCNPNKDNPASSFFGFPHWWQYINTGVGDALGGCTPTVNFSNGPSPILAIALAITDMLLYLAGIAAVISIIIAGISYIMAAGAPDKITAARKRIQNSLIGLGIVLVAATTVSFIGNAFIK
jgi:type IV secretory pathway VirB2 component (pilin)